MAMDYEKFKEVVLRLSTIDLSAYKERQMKRRLDSLIRKNSFTGYDDYIVALKEDTVLYKEFIAYMTINVSEFFRNKSQWEVLKKHILPQLFQNFGKKLTIWSAACSTGDEPYSLAMVLSEFMPLSQIKIIATDLDENVLAAAKVGLYHEKSISGVPSHFRKKYFSQVGDSYQIDENIKKCIEFRKHDLIRDAYPKNCDLIVCRNVLIYFTEEAKDRIYQRFNQSLKKNGILFVGSTEQIMQAQKYQFSSDYTFFYKKDGELH